MKIGAEHLKRLLGMQPVLSHCGVDVSDLNTERKVRNDNIGFSPIFSV